MDFSRDVRMGDRAGCGRLSPVKPLANPCYHVVTGGARESEQPNPMTTLSGYTLGGPQPRGKEYIQGIAAAWSLARMIPSRCYCSYACSCGVRMHIARPQTWVSFLHTSTNHPTDRGHDWWLRKSKIVSTKIRSPYQSHHLPHVKPIFFSLL